MNKITIPFRIALRIWLCTALLSSLSIFLYLCIEAKHFYPGILFLSFAASLLGSLPANVILLIAMLAIRRLNYTWEKKIYLLLFSSFLLATPYGILGGCLDLLHYNFYNSESHPGFLTTVFIVTGLIFSCVFIAIVFILGPIASYFSENDIRHKSFQDIFNQLFTNKIKINNNMETFQPTPTNRQPNRILIKGLITGALILVMLIPTLFINNLITEREARQKEVVKEVSSKWSAAQTLSAPFLVVPYTDTALNNDGKAIAVKTKLLLLANEVNVNGKIFPEQRPRSIYKVLLYKTDINMSGNFKVTWPADINLANVDYANARLCFSLSDFKGIEEEIYVNFNDQRLLLNPGLPVRDFGDVGLSTPVILTAENAVEEISFNMQVKIKGSEQLHFIPMSASSKFQISSEWPSPSFDGNILPGNREISENGFSARWNFNHANLPFGTVIKENTITGKTTSFGVSLVQPADQYNKTMRSVKYAILFIGLTFAFFFITELMQKEPFHPVQYVLVGLALVIFYTLLLAISEYILFDYAYIIAATATILLISLYAKGHFSSWKTAGIFFLLLSSLYGFIFILIRLEDTALLVGSIGLFVILALVMFVSRKIKWYGHPTVVTLAQQS
ncbi:MAG: cell envelope integrity protein CreD [Ferruginibacter sp.]